MNNRCRIWVALGLACLVPNLAEAANAAVPASPSENLTLQFDGVLWDGQPFDIALTGAGPAFDYVGVRSLVVSPEKMVLHAVVKETQGGYAVEINFSQSIPLIPAGVPGQTSTSYRNVTMQTTVLLKPGQAATLDEGNGQKMTLTLKPAPVVPSGAASTPPPMAADGSLDENLQVALTGTWHNGKPLNFSTLLANGTVTANLVNPNYPTALGTEMSAADTLMLKFTPEPGGGYRVRYILGSKIPIVSQPSVKNSAGVTLPAAIAYQDISAVGFALVKSLDEPVTLISSGDTKVTLVVSRAGQK